MPSWTVLHGGKGGRRSPVLARQGSSPISRAKTLMMMMMMMTTTMVMTKDDDEDYDDGNGISSRTCACATLHMSVLIQSQDAWMSGPHQRHVQLQCACNMFYF